MNFKIEEFNCKSGAKMPSNVLANVLRLMNNLQALRNEVKRPITITSGYRSPAHNRAIGGAKNSRHMFGDAADIKVKNMSPKQVVAIIEKLISEGKMEEGGIGIYPSWVHYDCSLIKRRW